MLRCTRKESLKIAFSACTADCTAEKKMSGLGYAFVVSSILILLIAALFVLSGCGSSSSDADPVSKAEVGDVVQFGEYEWRVLAKENGKALIITENVVDTRAYNDEQNDVTWENCTLRSYLNGEFYNGFSDGQKNIIAETKNSNPNNPDYSTSGGNETTDKVFCLSIEEAKKFFPSDDDRIAQYNGDPYSWWLRTPGIDAYTVSYVGDGGDVSMSGHFVDYTEKGYGGVRPALWVNL